MKSALWRFPWLSEPDREDIVQNARIKADAAHTRGQFPAQSSDAERYLWRLTYNCGVDWNRVNNPDQFASLPDWLPDSRSFLEDLLDHIDFERALERLDPVDQKIIKLYRQGYTFQEMADLLNMPLSTVYMRFRRAVQMLRRWLD